MSVKRCPGRVIPGNSEPIYLGRDPNERAEVRELSDELRKTRAEAQTFQQLLIEIEGAGDGGWDGPMETPCPTAKSEA